MAKYSAKDPIGKLKALFTKARELYYNSSKGETLMSDDEFDELEDIIREREPNWVGLKNTGAKTKKFKQKLPIPMASLDKVKAGSVDKWLDSRSTKNAVVSDKLDGSALQLVYFKGVPRKLYTRGDGVVGGDVSFLIPHLKIPQKIGTQDYILRCEALFSRSAFLKYKAEFDAARNAASGILNRQDVHRAVKDLSIMVLKVLSPSVPPSKGLAWAKAKGFTVVPYKVYPMADLTPELLTKLLLKRKSMTKYQLDGLVIEEDKINKPTKDKPDWAKAFKANISVDSAPVTTVRAVHWEVSHRAQVIPTIQFDPVEFEGAKVRFASAFNAKYVNEKGLGVGARVAILRSGDIIPFIAKIIKPVKPAKPNPKEVGDYTLDKNGTNYVLVKPADSEDFRIQRMLKFFNTLEVDFMRKGTITKLYSLGINNIRGMVTVTPQKLVRLGITQATALKLHNAIHSVIDKGVPLVTLMDASSTFPHGMGSTRFENISAVTDLEALLHMSPAEQEAILTKIPGFASTTINSFIKGAPKFVKWRSVVGIETVAPTKPKKIKLQSKNLEGVSVTFTGYRSKEHEDAVVKNGGQVVSFGGKTTHLLVSPSGKASSKEDKAKAKGIPVMTWETFSRKFKL